LKNKVNVFVHTIEDISYFLEILFDKSKEYTIYSSHAGVLEYTKANCSIKSILITSYKTQTEIDRMNAYCEKVSNTIISNLDTQYAQKISTQWSISYLNYFSSLYSYHLPFYLSGLFIFKELVLKLDTGDENIIFDYKDSFYGIFTLKESLTAMLKESVICINWQYSNVKSSKKSYKNNKIISGLTNLDKVYEHFLNTISEYFSYHCRTKKTILYMERLYDLKFITKNKDFRFIPYRSESLQHKFSRENHLSKNSGLPEILKVDEKYLCIEEFIAITLKKDFLNKADRYRNGLSTLDTLICDTHIDLAIWGNPPVSGFKALFYEYCKIKKIKVLGMQHGASYVDQNYQYHYISDFKRCDNYISYGFTQEDFAAVFPYYDVDKVTIHPFGTSKLLSVTSKQNKQKMDVIFPVTNTIGIFDGGFIRVKPDLLHKEQMQIIDILETASESNISSIIKPFKNTSIWQTSVFLRLKKLKFSKVEWNKSFTDVLNTTEARCVIIDFMSTPLYEVLGKDIDIFLFVHEADNLTKKARDMLERRVYIVDGIDEFSVEFEKWTDGELTSKRDSSYYDYYVKKENTEKNILQLMKDL